MATRHGLNSILYLGATNASAVAESHGIKVNVDTDFAEDSAQGDVWKTSLPGLSTFGFEIQKWYDNANHTLLDAVIAKTLQKFYFYPDRADATVYAYGTGYLGGGGFDSQINATIDQAYKFEPSGQPVYVHP